jgi:hypothetical protein
MRLFILQVLGFAVSFNASSQKNILSEDTLIKTDYHFSVTIPKGWQLVSQKEIIEQKSKSGNQALLMPVMAFYGEKKQIEESPHFYVVFYPQPKLAEKGFSNSTKIILSGNIKKMYENEMNKKFPGWSFKINDNEYQIDSANRMLMFSSFTKYSDDNIRVMFYCYFLMETGIAQINFSINKTETVEYTSIISKVLSGVKIEEGFKMVKN